MLKKKTNKKGFTLIELIVVIAVIAILAAVLLPRFTGFSDSAKKSSVLSEAKNIETGIVALVIEGKLDVDTLNKPDFTSTYTNYGGTLYIADEKNGDFIYADNGYYVTYTYSSSTFGAVTAGAPDAAVLANYTELD